MVYTFKLRTVDVRSSLYDAWRLNYFQDPFRKPFHLADMDQQDSRFVAQLH